MRTAIYARSAIAGGCEAQLKELRANVLQLGWKIIGEYLDDGVSGLRSRRPALDRLMADGEKGMFECVVVSDLERLSRNPRQLMQHLAHLQQLGLRFLAMNDKGFIGFAAQEHGEGIDSQAAKLMKPGSELNRNESLVL